MAITRDTRPVQAPCTARIVADTWPHPLTAEGRETRRLALRGHETLDRLAALEARRLGADTAEIAVALNGRPVQRGDWPETPLAAGDIVTLRRVPRGGDSDPLNLALTLAVVAAAAIIGGPIGVGVLGKVGASIAAAGVLVGGSLIVNAIAPPRQPDAPDPDGRGETLHSLAAGANRARPYAALPLVLGRHLVYPDLAAREYVEFAAADDRIEQYLHQIFNFGLGRLAISDLRLGATPLDDYAGVRREWAREGRRIALVAGNVDTVEGAALDTTDWIARTAAAGTARIAIDIAGQLVNFDKRGRAQRSDDVEIEIEHWPEGSPAAKGTRRATLSWDERTPYRRTIAVDLDNAVAGTAHHVRLRRLAEPRDHERVLDQLAWTVMRAYQPDPADYAGQTRLALRIRASGQLSGRLDRLSAIVQQRVPVWDGARWTAPRATSNPAWIYRWYARGVRAGGRLVAGPGLAPARIDDAAIKAWGAWCDDQGLECNHVIDRRTTHAEVLELIAQCGRASPSWGAGKLGAVWDEGGRPVTALITPENIVAGSLEVDWAAARGAEEIVCRYTEPDLDWQQNTVRRTLPGLEGTPSFAAALTLPGVTSAVQAAVECNLQAARQVYHRRRVSWEMGPEGLGIRRGDVVRITHGLLDGGIAGRVVGGTARRLRLSRPVEIGADDRMLLRLPDGRLHDTAVTAPAGAAGAASGEVVLATRLAAAPGADGASAMDILWRIYPASSPPAKLRVVAVRPLSDRLFRFEAIDEVEAYYRVATSNLNVAIPRRRPPEPHVLAATFAEVPLRIGTGWAVELTVSLATAGDWRGGEVYADDGGRNRLVATLAAGAAEASWLVRRPGRITVTVVPGSAGAPAGPAYTATYDVTGGGRDAGDFHAPVGRAIWDAAAAREAVADGPRDDDTVTLYRDDGSWAETRVWDGVAWRPVPRRYDGAVLADHTVHGDALALQSVTADKLAVNDLSAISADLGTIMVDGAHIADGAIDSAKIGDVIQSDGFEPGQSGWRIQRDGRAEFYGVVFSRQLQVDSGSLDLRAIQVRRTAQPAIAASWFVETARRIDAWDGARWTYLATAGLDNARVHAGHRDDPPDVLWGVQVTVLPLTIWSGPQVLRLKLDLWTQRVGAVSPTTGETWRIRWRLFRVT